MRATFEEIGGGGWQRPVGPSRVRGSARLALTVVLLVLAFGWGTLAAAAWDALSDQDARGVMDSTW
jgi:hypothetical protein